MQDLLSVPAEGSCDRVVLHTGNLATDFISGEEMFNRLYTYFETRSEEDFKSVVYPLSMDIPLRGRGESQRGIGKVDVNALVPPIFRERDRLYLPGPEGWKTALVPPHALATTHFDHPICGQVMAHFFGCKVTISIHQSFYYLH